jgi:hypothetical protein
MALTSTTLAVAIDDKQTEFKVTVATGFAVDSLLKVNSEFTLLKAVDTTTYWVRVERGQNGSLAVAHNILSLAVVGLPGDFLPEVPRRMYTYGAAGAITVGPGLHRLAAAAGAAMTLRAPRADEEGVTLLFVLTVAQAFTITLDSGAFNALTDPQIRITGAIGNGVELIAVGGSWMIAESKNITLPSVSPSSSGSKSASSSPSVSASSSPSVSPSASA